MDATIVSFVKEKMTLWPQTVDDDFVDRLHNHYTCALLLIFAAIGFLCATQPRLTLTCTLHSDANLHTNLRVSKLASNASTIATLLACTVLQQVVSGRAAPVFRARQLQRGITRTLLNSTVSELVSVTFACTAQSWEKYAESYCFIHHTYYVPWEEDIPMDSEKRTQRHAYYQWVCHRYFRLCLHW